MSRLAMLFLSDLSKETSCSIHYVDHGVGIVGSSQRPER